jgi:hypothetical protein
LVLRLKKKKKEKKKKKQGKFRGKKRGNDDTGGKEEFLIHGGSCSTWLCLDFWARWVYIKGCLFSFLFFTTSLRHL